GLGAALESVRGKLELAGAFEHPVPSSALAPLQPPTDDLKTLIEELVADAMIEGRNWPPEAQAGFLAQVESYRRLVILFSRLDTECSKITAFAYTPLPHH